TLYKLHGDFLFERFSLLASELPKQEENKLRLSSTGGGLIVIGHSGRDKTIMSILENISREDVPLGLYWLGLKTEEPPGLVKRLVNQHSCVRYCTIDSFDQFINSLFACSLSQEAGASLTVEPELSAVRTQFVAHKSGLLKLKEDIANAVERF